MRLSPRLTTALIAGSFCLASGLSGSMAAHGSMAQPTIVSENPDDTTPQLVASSTVGHPHVDAIATFGQSFFAGGLFTSAKDGTVGGATYSTLSNMMSFDAATNTILPQFQPQFDGNVWAVEADSTGVYVGGSFASVNGNPNGRAAGPLVKLNPTTGVIDPLFKPPIHTGQVNDLELRNGVLYAAGSFKQKLVALSTSTGADTGQISPANLGTIATPIPGAWGTTSVYSIAINPAGNQLVATGNFMTVGSVSRTRLFVSDLNATTHVASLDPWYYNGFAKPCGSTAPRRIAYLQGVDYSPDGSYFVVSATGQIPKNKTDVWHPGVTNPPDTTVCDGAGRFDLARTDPHQPTWINYTGGDSVWEIVATGAAVYVQGHFQWFDDPDGYASMCPSGQTCASRKGIAALDPVGGRALSWNGNKPSQDGGKAFLVTPAGLWVGSDSAKFHNEAHDGLAFVPLTVGS